MHGVLYNGILLNEAPQTNPSRELECYLALPSPRSLFTQNEVPLQTLVALKPVRLFCDCIIYIADF